MSGSTTSIAARQCTDSEKATYSSKEAQQSHTSHARVARLTRHFPDSCFLSNLLETGINTRAYAQLLIESTAFENPPIKAIFSNDNGGLGGAVVRDVNLGGGENQAPAGTLTSVPYSYELLGSANVKSHVRSTAGQVLSF